MQGHISRAECSPKRNLSLSVGNKSPLPLPKLSLTQPKNSLNPDNRSSQVGNESQLKPTDTPPHGSKRRRVASFNAALLKDSLKPESAENKKNSCSTLNINRVEFDPVAIMSDLAKGLSFKDDFDEYLARADSGGSTFGMLKRHAFAQSSLRVRPTPEALQVMDDAASSRQRSRSLAPASNRKANIENGKYIMAALCNQAIERRRSALPGDGITCGSFSSQTSKSGNLSVTSPPAAPSSSTLQVYPADYRRHSSAAACSGSLNPSEAASSGNFLTTSAPHDYKKRSSYVYADPASLLALQSVATAHKGCDNLGARLREPLQICRRRSFSVTPRGGLVNEGDELLFLSPPPVENLTDQSHQILTVADLLAMAGAGAGSRRSSYNSGAGGSGGDLASGRSSDDTSVYRILMLGGPGVGKTALVQQFVTSEFMAAQNTSFDDGREISVPVLLDGEESIMEFVDLPYSGELDVWKEYDVDAYVIVYSITDRRSFQKATEVIRGIRGKKEGTGEGEGGEGVEGVEMKRPSVYVSGVESSEARRRVKVKPIILVANKSDLERSRMIGKDEGKSFAQECDSKCIEVSAILNHKVDDLLVGILKQIRLALRGPSKASIRRRRSTIRRVVETEDREEVTRVCGDLVEPSCLSKTRNGFFSRLWNSSKKHRRLNSKSCENLLTL